MSEFVWIVRMVCKHGERNNLWTFSLLSHESLKMCKPKRRILQILADTRTCTSQLSAHYFRGSNSQKWKNSKNWQQKNNTKQHLKISFRWNRIIVNISEHEYQNISYPPFHKRFNDFKYWNLNEEKREIEIQNFKIVICSTSTSEMCAREIGGKSCLQQMNMIIE